MRALRKLSPTVPSNPSPRPYVRASLVSELLQLGLTAGMPWNRLLAYLNDVREADGRVPLGRGLQLWNELTEFASESAVPIRFAAASTLAFGELVHAGEGASSKRHMLETLHATFDRLSPSAEVVVDHGARRTQVVVSHHPLVESNGRPVEFLVALLVRFIADGFWPARLEDISFRHAPLGPQAAYAPWFHPSVKFEASVTSFTVDNRVLDQSFRLLDPLYIASSKLGAMIAAPSTATDLRWAVEEAARRGEFRVEALARHLGASPRSLQRRARAEGLELRQMIDAARQVRAVTYLRNDTLSLDEIAERLGYSEARSFGRAFARWTGFTPLRWREQNR